MNDHRRCNDKVVDRNAPFQFRKRDVGGDCVPQVHTSAADLQATRELSMHSYRSTPMAMPHQLYHQRQYYA